MGPPRKRGEYMTTLIEGFENTPFSGDGPITTWQAFDSSGGTAPTVVRTTSHVTQGTHTWEVSGSPEGGYAGIATAGDYDISAYVSGATSILIDVYVQTIGVLDYIEFEIFDDTFFSTASVFSTQGQTGAFTLTIDITGIADFSLISFFVGVVGGSFLPIHSAYDFYVDNMRASGGTPPPTVNKGAFFAFLP